MILESGTTDPLKLLPMKYPWAYQHYKVGVGNTWTPSEAAMQNDIELWKSDRLTEAERRVILWNLGFFSTAEGLTANNIILTLYHHIKDPACRMYMIRQTFEEANHIDSFIYIIESLNLDSDYVYNMYKTIPSIKEKDDFVVSLTENIIDNNFDATKDPLGLMQDLIGYYVILEGILFYSGFSMMCALKNKNQMVGVGEQFDWIRKDEAVHVAFGVDLINTIKEEYKGVWTKPIQEQVRNNIERAVGLEEKYVDDCCPVSFAGIPNKLYKDYVRYIADYRLNRLGLKELYKVDNPFPWMSKLNELNKEKNFFEARPNEYAMGTLEDWD